MMMNKELLVGFILLTIGIVGVFFKELHTIALFMVGFSLPTIIRGARKWK